MQPEVEVETTPLVVESTPLMPGYTFEEDDDDDDTTPAVIEIATETTPVVEIHEEPTEIETEVEVETQPVVIIKPEIITEPIVIKVPVVETEPQVISVPVVEVPTVPEIITEPVIIEPAPNAGYIQQPTYAKVSKPVVNVDVDSIVVDDNKEQTSDDFFDDFFGSEDE